MNNNQFEVVLKARVKRALNPSSSETPKDATSEAKIKYLVSCALMLVIALIPQSILCMEFKTKTCT